MSFITKCNIYPFLLTLYVPNTHLQCAMLFYLQGFSAPTLIEMHLRHVNLIIDKALFLARKCTVQVWGLKD